MFPVWRRLIRQMVSAARNPGLGDVNALTRMEARSKLGMRSTAMDGECI